MTRSFGKTSRNNLAHVHPTLALICAEALKTCGVDFSIIEGHRGEAEQETAFRLGNTKVHYPNSAHNQLPSLAVDIIPYPFHGWESKRSLADWKLIADAMFAAAKMHNVEIRWGGDFNRDKDRTTSDAWDKPHFELHPWRKWKDK